MYLIVGRVVRPHGIRGEVIVDVRTDDPESRFTVGAALSTSTDANTAPDEPAARRAVPPARPAEPAESVEPGEVRWTVPAELTIESVRTHQNRLIVAFRDVFDRNIADELRGVFLWVDAARIAPPADPDEFNDHQLIGLVAVTPSGETLGEVAAIDHAPAADLLVLRRPTGGRALVPFVREIVPEVDLPGRRVVIDPPAGLFDL